MSHSKDSTTFIRDEMEYSKFFPDKIREEALKVALDVRKFEIDLYWKRAAYFWTFIGATFVGFGAAQQLKDEAVRIDLCVVSCCLGLLFSFAWFCINKGSKYWQMNWEKHVDMLEDDIMGPLYKLNWLPDSARTSVMQRAKGIVLEFDRFSPTRINQLVSLFVFFMWIALLVHIVPINPKYSINPLYVTLITMTFGFCILILIFGQSGREKPLKRFKIRGEFESAKEPINGAESSGENTENANVVSTQH